MKLTSRIGETKSVSQVKEQIVDVHLDYIEKDGYVWRYNEDTKKYYNTGICLMGKQGNSGPPGRKGDNGLSAYQIAREHGFDGNVQAWLDSLKGKSTYEIAVENGFEGTVEEWLDQISGEGKDGKSAYQIWQEQPGNENKSVSEFLAWIKDTSSMIGPKYAATTNDCVMVNNTPTLYYVPNGSTFDVYLADEQGVAAKSLATGVPGDITNYAGIYDVSADHNDTQYASLSAALVAIPTTVQKGGMTIKFIDSESGKYVQYRLTNTDFSTEISDWESTDELKNALGFSSESTEGYDILKPEIQVGYFERKRVNQQTGGTQNRYAIINLLAGEKIRLNGSTPTNIGRIGTYISDSNLSDVVMGESSSNKETYPTEYTAPEDISIILGFSDNVPFLIEKWTISTKQTSILSSLQSDVNDIKESLDMDGSESTTAEENVELTENYGYWNASTSRATISTGSSTSRYSYSDFIAFKKGDVLTVKANAQTTVGVITRKDYYEDGIYRTVQRGTDELETFTYTVPYDEELAFCWLRTTGISVKKTAVTTNKSSATLAELSERIDEVEDNIVPTINERIAELGIESTIEDDLTEGLEDGKFVSINGQINGNENYSYKLYNVTSGTEIAFNAVFHTNLCPIAKKTSTSFEPLVASPGSVRADVSYTVPMDMVVALSFKNDRDRTVIIHSSKIAEIDGFKQEVGNVKTKLLSVDMDYGLLFDKIAVIGDSLSVGTLDGTTGDDAHVDGGDFGCSWLTCLAKRWGSSIRQHYATGGSTCYSWLGSNNYGLGLMLKDSVAYDVYFIAYGHNDAGQFTIGATSDTPTEVAVDANNDVTMEAAKGDTTFLGNYKKIVNEVRTKAPNAIIFMLSTDSKNSNITSSIGYMNQPIRELAEWYYEQGDHKIFYVDYINRYEAKEGYRHGGHWSTFGYVNVARLINEAINEVIDENLTTNALKVWGNYLNGQRTTRINTTESGSFLPHL